MNSVVFNNTGTILTSGSYDKTINIYNINKKINNKNKKYINNNQSKEKEIARINKLRKSIILN